LSNAVSVTLQSIIWLYPFI